MDKNTKTIRIILIVVAVMIGLSFASVPLYRIFCQRTGFDGTTQVSKALPDPSQIVNREITIKFDANTAKGFPWDFRPEHHQINVKLGQQGIIAFLAKNKTAHETAGTAIYNVTPEKVGKYFHKIQCFCFSEQVLKPHQETQMPVLFYVDPKFNDDPDMEDVNTITLSYTFYPADSPALDKATEAFYNGGKD